jgi:secreted trypsin-like serine protease
MKLLIVLVLAVAQTAYGQINEAGCGVSALDSVDKIVNGQAAAQNKYPWQAVLLNNGRFSCGSTIINDRWILTAAHCMQPPNAAIYSVEIGSINRGQGTTIRANRTINHPNYNPSNFQNDIALLQLATPIASWTTNIRPICLADANTQCDDNPAGVSIGWGQVSQNGAAPIQLLELNYRFPTNAQCFAQYQFVMPSYNVNLVVCGGSQGGNAGICFGDSGGPKMVRSNNAWTQCGVHSWIVTPCGNGGVSARVSNYIPWIIQTIANNP